MRKRKIILAAALAVATVGLLASVSQAGISGSAHDFGSLGWADHQICKPCHTPHNAMVLDADGSLLAAPLWNHTLSTATYVLYKEADSEGNVEDVTGEVDQNSKLCLSCHDGTVAVDSFGGGGGTQEMTDAGAVLGTDLSNDHPIGEHAIWPTPNPSYMVDPALRVGTMPLRPMADGRLAVGCTSCHEPHNRRNTENMLWVNNEVAGTTVDGRAVSGSVLCLNCHKK